MHSIEVHIFKLGGGFTYIHRYTSHLPNNIPGGILNTLFFSCAGSRRDSLLARPLAAALAGDGIEVIPQADAAVAMDVDSASRRDTTLSAGRIGTPAVDFG